MSTAPPSLSGDARVLAARGIASRFLTENLVQVRDALAVRLSEEQVVVVAPYFQSALDASIVPGQTDCDALGLIVAAAALTSRAAGRSDPQES